MSERRILTAAATIAVLTVLVRAVGFVRTLVFAGAVGATDLGDVYQTANMIPTILFDATAGGVLAAVVVPLLARFVAGDQPRHVADVASALLTWTVVLLLAIGIGLALFADPVVALFLGDADEQQWAAGARMLRVFAVQVPLYGVAVVFTGILHAHHRFVGPVIAPLLSSVVVIGAYVGFAAVDGPGVDVAHASRTGELILSIGTTLGVGALAACVVIPARRLDLRLRMSFTLSDEIRRQAVRLASAGVVTVFVQQLALAVLVRLANDASDGTLVLFLLAQAMFLVPWAVLAVPLSTPVFPVLAEAAAVGDQSRFDAALARTTRAVLLATGLGVAVLVGGARPLGQLLASLTAAAPPLVSTLHATTPPAAALPAAIVAFAPGLFGFALFTLHVRALNAAGHAWWGAGVSVVGWVATIIAGWVLSAVWVEPDARVVVLAAAHSVGMTVLGGASLAVIAHRRGKPALVGFLRMLSVGLGGAGLAGLVGLGAGTVGQSSVWGLALAFGCATAAYLAVALMGCRGHDWGDSWRRLARGSDRIERPERY